MELERKQACEREQHGVGMCGVVVTFCVFQNSRLAVRRYFPVLVVWSLGPEQAGFGGV